MKTGVYPLFKDLFPNETSDLEILLEGFTIESGLTLVSSLNAEIYFRSNKISFEEDIRICNLFMRCVSKEIQNDFLRNLTIFAKKINYDFEKLGIFTQKNILSFTNYLIMKLSSNSVREYDDGVDDFNFLKAYFLFVENNDDSLINKIDFNISNVDFDENFYNLYWPILINQFEFHNNSKSLKYQMLLGIIVLHLLSNDERYSSLVDGFLNKLNLNNFFEYIYQIASHFDLKRKEGNNIFNRFLVKTEEPFLGSFYESNAINIDDFKADLSSLVSFIGLKSRPLFKLSNGTFLVLDWSLFFKKMYDSLYFDLFERTQFKIHFKGSFPEFKNKVVSEMLEEKVFVKLMDSIYKKKYSVTIPKTIDDKHEFADYYIRNENKVFLFEFKSSLFSGKVKDSINVVDIKIEIDNKLNKFSNKKSKGSGQLYNQIKKMNDLGFSFDKLDLLNYKKNKIEVYPIIVVDEEMFLMPGVNEYIKKEFRKQVDLLDVEMKIIDITIISLEFFLSKVSYLKENRNEFHKLIKDYHKTIRVNKKRIEKGINMKEYQKIYQNFEQFFEKKLVKVRI